MSKLNKDLLEAITLGRSGDHKIREILVVDDDPITCKTVSRVLTETGYQVRTASNGIMALNETEKKRPDLILLDVMMPGLDGFETCRALRKITGKNLPIIMLTGLSDIDSVDQGFNAGATDFMTKPLNWALLGQRIRYALRNHDTQLELMISQTQLSHAQQLAKLGYWHMDYPDGQVYLSNEAANILGIEGQESISRQKWDLLTHPEDSDLVHNALQQALISGNTYQIDHRIQKPDGNERTLQQQGEVIINHDHKGGIRIIGTVQDITERRRTEDLIRYQQYYDTLTGLPNRRMFNEQLGKAMAEQGTSQIISVMMVSLDRLKLISDTYGHLGLDIVMRQVADHLKDITDHNWTVCRFGEDSFGVMVRNLRHINETNDCANHLQQLLKGKYHIKDQAIHLTASIGVALFPLETCDRDGLLKGADTAMRKAREHGGEQYRYYSTDMDMKAQEKLFLEQALRHALENKQLELFYQPQIHLATGHLIGMEALLRWNHPQKGAISPAQFIPIAEESGLIIPIGKWVLHQACVDAHRWITEHKMELRVGVNLSTRQFLHEDIFATVVDTLNSTSLSPHNLDLEITESLLMDDKQSGAAVLGRLRDLGIKTSIDDFGTGYSSLSYLNKLPVDTLKIDQSFVKNILQNGENGSIAKAIIALAHGLDKRVIAEGVEHQHQADFLRQNGCNEVQGYFYSRPLSKDGFVNYIRNHSSTRN